jgi:hydrogenase-1 operon protein HyaF
MSASRANDALQAIGLRVEGSPRVAGAAFTGNVLPLLHEVRHALERLLATGEETTIDLASLPLAPGEFDRIEAALGQGEVTATLNALGPSEIRETRYSGVWLVTHRNATDEVMGRYIEIARMPSVLLAQEPDMRKGLADLALALEGRVD